LLLCIATQTLLRCKQSILYILATLFSTWKHFLNSF
jgi:hypothetical protein